MSFVHMRCCTNEMLYKQGVVHPRCCTNEVAPDRHGAGGASRVSKDVEGYVSHAETQVWREAHADDDLHGPVYDDTGGDDNDDEAPHAQVKCDTGAKEKDNKKDKAVPDNTGGGGAVPTSDNTEAGDLKFMMSKISLLARRGGGQNETCGSAHFILVAKSALHSPRVPRWVHLAADAPSDNSP